MNRLNIAIAAEFELCEKLAECLENSALKTATLRIVEIYPFNEEQGIRFNNSAVEQLSVAEVQWSDYDYVLFAGEVAFAEHIANAAEAGCVVIDMKGVCASVAAVPLILPTINDDLLMDLPQANILALPDPQVSQAALALVPLLAQYPLSQVLVTSLLPASYSNAETVSKLAGQTARLLNGIPLEENEQRFAFDVFPKSAVNLAAQLQKLFPTLNAVFHSVQVPVFYGTAQKLTALSDYEIDSDLLLEQWKNHSLISLEDNLITPVSNANTETENAEQEAKLHLSNLTAVENGVEFWTVADEQRFTLAILTVKLLEKICQTNH